MFWNGVFDLFLCYFTIWAKRLNVRMSERHPIRLCPHRLIIIQNIARISRYVKSVCCLYCHPLFSLPVFSATFVK